MRGFISSLAHLIHFITERSCCIVLEEVIEASPKEGSRLLDDGLIGHEHLPQLRQLLVGVLLLVYSPSEVVARVCGRASGILVLCLRILILEQVCQTIIIHLVVVLVGDDCIITWKQGNCLWSLLLGLGYHLEQGQCEDIFVHFYVS